MTHYLGIDPGTACGWAILDEHGNRIGSGVWDLSPQRHEGAGMRYLRLRHYLNDALNSVSRIDAVGYEEVARHAGTQAAHIYGGIVATVQTWCENANIPYSGVPVGTVKRTATGKGSASKVAMIQAANVRWPEVAIRVEQKTLTNKKTGEQTIVDAFPGGGDNEADALHIADTLRRGLV